MPFPIHHILFCKHAAWEDSGEVTLIYNKWTISDGAVKAAIPWGLARSACSVLASAEKCRWETNELHLALPPLDLSALPHLILIAPRALPVPFYCWKKWGPRWSTGSSWGSRPELSGPVLLHRLETVGSGHTSGHTQGRTEFQATRQYLVEWGKILSSIWDPPSSDTHVLEKFYRKSSLSKSNVSLLPVDIHLEDDSNTSFSPIPSFKLEFHK